MSEKITAVKVKENISKNPFYSCPGGGTFELNSFHLAGHFTNSDFKSSNARGGMLKFQIDRYITMFEVCQLCTLLTSLYNGNYMSMEMLVYY